LLNTPPRAWSLDHPLERVESSFARVWGTAHALAVAKFFTATQSFRQADLDVSQVRAKVCDAARVCRLLMGVKAPIFLGAPGTGLEDDHTYASALFVRRDWPPVVADIIGELYADYVRAGFIELEVPLSDEHSIIGSTLPVDGAIRIGNSYARAAISAGCQLEGVATDSMGRKMDLMDYIQQSGMAGTRERTAAMVTEALMRRHVDRAATAATLAPPPASRRRRAEV
jgi:hypothetical protein